MTNILDILTYADGSLANGRLVVFWKPFVVSNITVAGGELEFQIVAGAVSLSLYSNANALPVGSYYNAKYELENGAVYVEQWIVPNVPSVNLGQVKVSFPPSPSVIISPLQLSSLGSEPGMFLMWDGSKWVPGYPSTFNINPNYISVNLGNTGNDVNITGSPVALGGVVTINIPSANFNTRGVVTSVAQTFGGAKTFSNDVTVVGNATMQGTLAVQGYTSLSSLAVSGSATVGSLTCSGQANIKDLNVTGSVILPPNSYVPVTRRIFSGNGLAGGGDLSQDRTLSVVDDTSNQRVKVLYNNNFIDTRPTLNFIEGSNISMHVNADVPSNSVWVNVSAVGLVPATRQIFTLAGSGLTGGGPLNQDLYLSVLDDSTTQRVRASYKGTLIATRPEINFVPDSTMSVSIVDSPNNRADVNLTVNTDATTQRVRVAANGTVAGTRPQINFIPGANISFPAISDDPVNNRVNVTIASSAATGMGVAVDGSYIGAAESLYFYSGSNITLVGNMAGNVAQITISSVVASGVTSVFTRTGAVVAQATDYSAFYVPLARQVIAGAGLAGGGDLSANRTFAVVNDTVTQRVRASVDGTLIGTRQEINFVTGANVTLSGLNDSINNRVNITIASTGGGSGGGMADPTTTLGDLIVRGSAAPTRLAVGTSNGMVLTVDATAPLGVKWGAAASQTPWLSNIDGASFALNNAGTVGINQASIASIPLAITARSNASDATILINPPDSVAQLGIAMRGFGLEAGYILVGSDNVGNAAWAGMASIYSSVDLIFWKARFPTDISAVQLMRIKPTGKVAIGTNTAPAYQLEVAGDCNLVGGVYRVNGVPLSTGSPQTPWASNIDGATFNLTNVTQLAIGATSPAANMPVTIQCTYAGAVGIAVTNWSSAGVGQVNVNGFGGPNVALGSGGSSYAGRANQGYISFDNGASFAIYGTGTDRLHIDSTGKIGISKPVPAFLLDVAGDVNTTGVYRVNGVQLATGSPQTPWASDIDAAGFQLNNAKRVGIVASGQSVGQLISGGVGSMRLEADAGKSLTVTGDPLNVTSRSNYISFQTNVVERMRILASGEIGIGNVCSPLPDPTSPVIRLMIGSTSTGGGLATLSFVGNSATAGTGMGSLNFANYNLAGSDKRIAAINGQLDSSATSGLMDFYVWNTAGTALLQMRMTSAGVGIANTLAALPYVDATATQVVVGPGAGYGGLTVACNSATAGSLAAVMFANYAISAADKRLAMIAGSVGSASNVGQLDFYTWSAGAPGQRMSITAIGVGIGTTGPGSPLEIAAHGNTLNSFGQLVLRDLDVAGTGNPYAAMTGIAQDGTRIFFIGKPGGVTFLKSLIFWNDINGPIQLGTNGQERMRIDPAGNVGIGVTAPSRLLQIQSAAGVATQLNFTQAGTASFDIQTVPNVNALAFATGAGSELMRITGAGSVGIGTSSPNSKLDVAGNLAVTTVLTGTFDVSLTVSNTNASALVGAGILRVAAANNNGSNQLMVCVGNTTTVFSVGANGAIVAALPSANPGAGSKQFWYDPADSNRVKFAP